MWGDPIRREGEGRGGVRSRRAEGHGDDFGFILFFFFFFFGCPKAYGVSRPGIRFEPQV